MEIDGNVATGFVRKVFLYVKDCERELPCRTLRWYQRT